MRKMRKAIHLLLVVTLTLGLAWTPQCAADTVFAAEEKPVSGTFGELNWELTKDDTSDWDLAQGTPYRLTLTGSGEMKGGVVPWSAYRATITSVSIAEGITTVGNNAFYQCVSLKSITIPDSVTKIGGDAFKGCTLLENVNFGNSVEEIGLCAFENCISLKSIAIPDSVTIIGGSAFKSCRALATFVCGAGLKEIGSFAFNDTGISGICFQDGLEVVGDNAFYNSGLKTISLPPTVTYLGRMAFADTSLSELTIPESVTEIGGGILYNVNTLKRILVEENNPVFFVQDGALYEQKGDHPYRVLAYAGASGPDAIKIADGTEIIDEYAFARASNLTSVQLPDTLKTIGNTAFSHCSGIEEISIPDCVEKIGLYAFSYNTSLASVSVGKGLEKCPGTVFSGCRSIKTFTVSQENPFLESVDHVVYNKSHTELYFYAPAKEEKEYHILDTVEQIFSSSICMTAMLEELFMPENLTQIYSQSISDNRGLRAIYFPGNAPDNKGNAIGSCSPDLVCYRTEGSVGWEHPSWASYTFADWRPEDHTKSEGEFGELAWKYEGETGRMLFMGAGAIPDFTENEPAPWSAYMGEIQTIEAQGVTAVGDYAFYRAGKLILLRAGDTLREIGDFALAGCGGLSLVDFGGLEVIGASAFQNNASLKGDVALERAAVVGEGAFKGCEGITGATLGTALTSLEREAFSDCTSLRRFLVPQSVSVIREGALSGCVSLRTVNIPSGVTTIGAQAFAGDSALERVYFYGDVPKNWAADSFADCGEALTLCYRASKTEWERFDGLWNALPLVGLERFYTEGRDHYSFGNTMSSFGYTPGYRFLRQRYVDVLESIIAGTYYYAINKKWNGSCYGMAVSTLEFYENSRFNVKDYDRAAEWLYDIEAPGNRDSALTRLIEEYQISQYKTEIAGYGGGFSRNRDAYREMIWKVEEFERSGGLSGDAQAEPIVMLVGAKNSAHAVIPVSVDQDANGDFLLQVYDPNKPAGLQTLRIYKDFRGISYGSCFEASYIEYSEIAKAMAGAAPHQDRDHGTLYLSIDKETGKVVDEDARELDQIEGAYEQKPFAADGDDNFSGIKSFVLPGGNYQLFAEETQKEENVTFYLATDESFAQITSTDADAALTVNQKGTGSGGLEISLQSESTEKETVEITVMNRLGMERAIEISGANASVAIPDDNTITVEVLQGEEVLIDKKPVELKEQKAVSSFAASDGENPWKTTDFEAGAVCNERNELSGTANVTVICGDVSGRDAAVAVEYFDADGRKIASYTEDKRLNAGWNTVALSYENLPTDFQEQEGEAALSCVLTVSDKEGNAVTATAGGVAVSLTKQPEEPGTEEPGTEEPGTEEPGTEEPGTEEPGTEEPGTEEPGTEEPGTEEPGTEEPGTEKPGTQQPKPPADIAVTEVAVEEEKLTFGAGEKYKLNASVIPGNASDKTLKFAASGAAATVDAAGNITAKKPGTAYITVSSANGKKAVITVIVKKAPKKITLKTTKKTLKAGKTFRIKVKLPKNTASRKITYSSSKKSVADVSSDGVITAKKRGTTTITVKTFNGKKAKLKLTVKGEIAVKKVVVSTKTLTLGIGEIVWLNAAVYPQNASDKKLTFRASNKTVKVDSKGKVTAVREGTCTVTVKAKNGKKAVIKVIVKKAANALPAVYN